MVKNKEVYRVITFAGWWMTFLAVALSLFFAYTWLSAMQSVVMSAAAFASFGLLIAAIGEFMLAKHSTKKHKFVWEAMAMGGIFCMSAGLLWLALQLQSVLGIFVLMAAGVTLIFLGESQGGIKK